MGVRILCFILFSLSLSAQAQLNKTSDWEFSALTGPILPSSISGLTDTVMVSGARIGKGMSYYRPEVLYVQGSEAGSSYRSFFFSAKNPLYLKGADDITPYFLVGLQAVQYEPVFSGVTGEKQRGNGFHLGFGLEINISRNLQVRNDYYFTNGPGRTLLVTLGLQLRFGGEKDAGAQR